MLRRNHILADHGQPNMPLTREMTSPTGELNNSLNLIRQEIAIMKKLNHPNVVSLIEVLDDPSEDLLYMVLEMCKKGVVMKVGLGERSDPYDMERCRLWFRDMILGVEYRSFLSLDAPLTVTVHAQGIIHRDIKPDNCLITSDDVLKIVDFGVSEMFSKDSDMATDKSAGSPAFMPPELCVARHGEVSGRACDIWSMGVTLYCLAFGCIPFEKSGIFDLYESIKNDEVKIPDHCDHDLRNLLGTLLEKDPSRRIEMDDIRVGIPTTCSSDETGPPLGHGGRHRRASPQRRKRDGPGRASDRRRSAAGHHGADAAHGQRGEWQQSFWSV